MCCHVIHVSSCNMCNIFTHELLVVAIPCLVHKEKSMYSGNNKDTNYTEHHSLLNYQYKYSTWMAKISELCHVKPDLCICENQGTDQMCCSHTAGKPLVLGPQMAQSLYFLIWKCWPLTIFCSLTAWFVLHLFGNSEDKDAAHIWNYVLAVWYPSSNVWIQKARHWV